MEKGSDFNKISLSLIIPVFNEEQSILSSIESNLQALKDCLSTYEVIIVNDGSVDASQSIIDDFIKGKENLFSIQKKKNEGFGSAVKAGLAKSVYDYILPVPVDCPLDTPTLKKFLANIGNNDIVVGYRTGREGYSMRMILNSYVFHQLISFLFKIKLIDYNWIHLYKRKIFTDDGIEITSKGILMLAEVLIKSKRKGLLLKEIDIAQRERLTGVATASKFTTLIKTFKEIVHLYKSIGRGK